MKEDSFNDLSGIDLPRNIRCCLNRIQSGHEGSVALADDNFEQFFLF